jgi:hypothetical protein
MERKWWIVIVVLVIVAVVMVSYNYFTYGFLLSANYEIAKEGEGPQLVTKNECPQGKKVCRSHDQSSFVCCDAATENCGSSGWGYGKKEAWCYPKGAPTDEEFCAEGETFCSRGQEGDGVACCPQGWTCKKYEGAAWCSPNSQAECPPGKVHCGAGNGGGSKDNACCLPPPAETCVEDYDYSWCESDESICEGQGPGYQKCGFYCCNPNQECRGNGVAPDGCSQKPNVACPVGQEKCTGTANDYPVTICCNAGQCHPAQNGPPTCLDNDFNPPPQSPPPKGLQFNPSDEADPSEAIKDVISSHLEGSN